MKVFLHIGSEKTGTSTLQKFLSVNKEGLAKKGYLFPNDLGINHTFLAIYAAESNSKVKDLLMYRNLPVNKLLDDYRVEIQSFFENLFKGKTNVENLILSSEHCSSRLTKKSEILRLKKLFDSLGLEVKLILYLRRQSEFLISLYNTYILTGGTKEIHEFMQNIHLQFNFNYENIVNYWSEVFGKENLIVRVYEKNQLINNNTVDDFLNTIGIDDASKFSFPNNENVSIDSSALEFLRRINFHIPTFENDKVNKKKLYLVDQLKKIPKQFSYSSQISLESFDLKFSDSNRRVAEEFIGRSNLFISVDKICGLREINDEAENELDELDKHFLVFARLLEELL